MCQALRRTVFAAAAPDRKNPYRNSGKVANDHNKVGDQALTQKNQAERTPASRTDREAHIGSGNQTQSRRGNTGR